MLTNVADKDILIIEDAEPLAIQLGKYLKKLGYKKIHYCKNGTLGIRKFQELVESNNVPVVFLDYFLPDITALLVLKQILEIHPSTNVIIETMANVSESGIKRLFELGAHSYLPKPYELEKLKEIMNTLEDCQGIVIDDDPDMVDSISNILEDKGVCIIGKGSNGEEAFQMFKKLRPKFVILDMKMPEYDGAYAIKKIKNEDPNAKIIVLTGYPEYAFDKNEVTAVFTKPFNTDEIVSLIQDTIC